MLKCVIWDLDQTLWDGTLAEGDATIARPEALALVHRLEALGVVQSIASKNEHRLAMAALEQLGIAQLFVYPEISWSAKSVGVARIIESLGVGADTVLLLDDSEFERAEVAASVAHVRCESLASFLAHPEHQDLPDHVTDEGAARPETYRREARRRAAQERFEGPPAEFLASLGLELSVRSATAADLERAEELTERTNQLNTTGTTFSAQELSALLTDPNVDVLMAELTDRFGDYGRIGLVLLRQNEGRLVIELMLVSCRVMGRNVTTALLAFIGRLCVARGLSLRAGYRASPHNRQMKITYAFVGFQKAEHVSDSLTIYEHPDPASIACPPYIRVISSLQPQMTDMNASSPPNHAFTDRWVDRFASAYADTPLRDIPWFTAAPGIKLVQAFIDGLIVPGSVAVDLGCGPGVDAVFLATCGVSVTAIDPSAEALAKARALAQWAGVALQLVQADARQTSLADGFADIVNDSFVFHNFKDDARAPYAAEIHRILKPGGLFLLSAFSDAMVAGSGPRRITSEEIFASFTADRFVCQHIELYRNLPTPARPVQRHWFAVFRKREEG